MRQIELLVAMFVVGWMVAAPAGSQERPISGVIRDSVSGLAVEGAEVYFTTVSAGDTRTRADGRFHLIGRSVRDSMIVVRRIGYVPRTITVTPAAHWLATIDIGVVYLRPTATELDKIAVEAEEVRRFPQLEGFYQRKAKLTGLGHFLTRDVVTRTAALRTSDVLRESHKLEIECGKGPAGQCVATSRRARETRLFVRARGDSLTGEDETFSFSAGRCRMDVWVDGVRSPLGVDAIPVDWIVGIEVYSGPATTPPVFGMGACGVIAIWTSVPGA